MKKIATAALAATLAALAANAEINVVPRPVEVVEKDGFCHIFRKVGKADVTDRVKYVSDPAIPKEGYRLSVKESGITVASSDAAGKFYAIETLKQLARSEKLGIVVPCVEIRDAPRYPWRGVHLDECRHFFGKEVVKGILDKMATYKLNRFHWHLTEDQGWRIDVPGYPELVKYGAVRPESPKPGFHVSKPGKGNRDKMDHTPYGPFFYTEADLREIVAYAAERHIQVVPEIELPGHVYAALAAYPEFACKPENLRRRQPRTVWGIEPDVLCIGNDKAVKFMEDVLDYVCKVFPGNVIHIGGDECPSVRWKDCPKCKARMAANGIKSEKDLQPWITRHFVDFLAKRGRRTIGWDEYLIGDIPKNAMGMSWRVPKKGRNVVTGAAAAERGHDVVMSPGNACYLDKAQGLKDDKYQYIGGNIPLSVCYGFDPSAGVSAKAAKHILGGQGNNWTEYTWGREDLEWKMWPRMLALAEVFWLGEKKPGFDDFKRRAAVQREALIKSGVNCAPLK